MPYSLKATQLAKVCSMKCIKKIKQTCHYDVTDSLHIHEGLICTSKSLVLTFSGLSSRVVDKVRQWVMCCSVSKCNRVGIPLSTEQLTETSSIWFRIAESVLNVVKPGVSFLSQKCMDDFLNS